MKVIGLTGGIGSGKSTVAQFLVELGAVIIDADKVGHEAFKSGTELWREVVAAFGQEIITPDGDIAREKLGEIVFDNAEALSRLNQIMHPRMYDMVRAQIEGYRKRGVEVVVLEAPLLIEANWTSLVDEVWVTVAAESKVLRRVADRTGLPESETLARIRSQMPVGEKTKYADVVINNDGDLGDLKARVNRLWQKLRTERNG